MANLTAVANTLSVAVNSEADRGWTTRLRVGVMESDTALRSVLTRTLLRAGCVVQFRRTLEQTEAALRGGEVDAVVADVDNDRLAAIRLASLVTPATVLIILVTVPADPYLTHLVPGVRFYQKPFDARLLLQDLGLGEPSRLDHEG